MNSAATGRVWAHSPNQDGRWHPLEEHLAQTGDLAAGFAAPFHGQSLARWIGRAHDLGKARCEWQDALASVAGSGAATGVPHKQHAARLARKVGGHPSGMQVASAAAALIGHHGGMPDVASRDADRLGVKDVVSDASLDAQIAESLGAVPLDLTAEAADVTLPDWLPMDAAAAGDRAAARRVEMFTRMSFSTLVDADFLDTARHFHGTPVAREQVAMQDLLEVFLARRAVELGGAGGSTVNTVRDRVFADAMHAADSPPGLFRLPAPTGTGKTFAAMGFGLSHAAQHGLRRVIVAVPFTSITQQNAAVYRKTLDSAEHPRVLEHHSAILNAEVGANRWRRLAAQNWDAPVVVTTMVQLFDALLSNKPSRCRRLHRLARSVVVLDEVQALPLPLLPVLLEVLRTLVQDYGATVVLSSATQPAFWSLPVWDQFPATPMIRDPQSVQASSRRVRYEWRTGTPAPWATVADWMSRQPSAMTIVNSTADAALLHQLLEDRCPETLHLSTRMCPVHRSAVLEEVVTAQQQGQPVRLVATQLVEAGVDLDFPTVLRALAPAESIAQAGGRANRNGRLATGEVIVFTPQDGHTPPGEYATATSLTQQRFAANKTDPDDAQALEAYYQSLYQQLLPQGRSPDSDTLTQSRSELAFRSTAEAFQMINDVGVDVLVGYDDPTDQVPQLVAALEAGDTLTGAQWRFLQARTASLTPSKAREAEQLGLARPISGDQAAGLLLWLGRYHPRRGIVQP